MRAQVQLRPVQPLPAFRGSVARHQRTWLSRSFAAGGLLFVEDFLEPELLGLWRSQAQAACAYVHRVHVPGRRAGSVGLDHLSREAPAIHAAYLDSDWHGFLRDVTRAPLEPCPPRDLHAVALYVYDRPGDQVGWHYDLSFYRGHRYTVLFCLEEAPSVRLLYRIAGQSSRGALRMRPGSLVLFEGNTLLHRTTPLPPDERRVVTMEYVTSCEMSRLGRLLSDLKDAAAYFGWRAVAAAARRRP